MNDDIVRPILRGSDPKVSDLEDLLSFGLSDHFKHFDINAIENGRNGINPDSGNIGGGPHPTAFPPPPEFWHPMPPAPLPTPTIAPGTISITNANDNITPTFTTNGINVVVSGVPFGGKVEFRQFMWWDAFFYYIPAPGAPSDTEPSVVKLPAGNEKLEFAYYPKGKNRIGNSTLVEEPLKEADAQTGGRVFDSTPAERPGDLGEYGFLDTTGISRVIAQRLFGNYAILAPPNTILDRVEVTIHLHLVITVYSYMGSFSRSLYWKVKYTIKYVTLQSSVRSLSVTSTAERTDVDDFQRFDRVDLR